MSPVEPSGWLKPSYIVTLVQPRSQAGPTLSADITTWDQTSQAFPFRICTLQVIRNWWWVWLTLVVSVSVVLLERSTPCGVQFEASSL